jgi:hypothetical protein
MVTTEVHLATEGVQGPEVHITDQVEAIDPTDTAPVGPDLLDALHPLVERTLWITKATSTLIPRIRWVRIRLEILFTHQVSISLNRLAMRITSTPSPILMTTVV